MKCLMIGVYEWSETDEFSPDDIAAWLVWHLLSGEHFAHCELKLGHRAVELMEQAAIR